MSNNKYHIRLYPVLKINEGIKKCILQICSGLAKYLIVQENDVFLILSFFSKKLKTRIIIITMRSQTSLSCNNMASIIKYYDCVWWKHS